MILQKFTYMTEQKNHNELPYKWRMPVIFQESHTEVLLHTLSTNASKVTGRVTKLHLNYSYVFICNLSWPWDLHNSFTQSSTKTLLARFVVVPRRTMLFSFLFLYQWLTSCPRVCIYPCMYLYFFIYLYEKILTELETDLAGLAMAQFAKLMVSRRTSNSCLVSFSPVRQEVSVLQA